MNIVLREYRCGWRRPDGTVCGATFNRKWNLKRHRVQHDQGKDRQRASANIPGTASLSRNAAPVTPQIGPGITVLPRVAPLLATTNAILPGIAPTTFAGLAHDDFEYRASSSAQSLFLSSSAQSPLLSSPPSSPPDTDLESPEAKRYWSERKRFEEPIPSYEVKLSRSAHQQKAIEWLSDAGKRHFESWIRALMASWGFSSSVGSCGMCFTCPADWMSLEADEVVRHLNQGNSPKSTSTRPIFRYSDHTTAAARAAAWYGQWPRSGVELDNFLECGPFQRMDGSHLCHNRLCILPSHIVYEPVAVNESRAECSDRARFLRVHGRPVPAACDKHNPPCLMQHAVLTMYERCLIQLWLYRAFRGLESPPQPQRPRRYPFPSLEYELPVRSVGVEQAIDVRVCDRVPVVRRRLGHKPGLVCNLCLSTRIIGFSSVVALWGHVVHRHKDRSDKDRLGEVRRTAGLWRQYLNTELALDRYSVRSLDPTLEKLVQVELEGFVWADVEHWDLRS